MNKKITIVISSLAVIAILAIAAFWIVWERGNKGQKINQNENQNQNVNRGNNINNNNININQSDNEDIDTSNIVKKSNYELIDDILHDVYKDKYKNYYSSDYYKIFQEIKSPYSGKVAILFGLDIEKVEKYYNDTPSGIFINDNGYIVGKYDFLRTMYCYFGNVKWVNDKEISYDSVCADDIGQYIETKKIYLEE